MEHRIGNSWHIITQCEGFNCRCTEKATMLMTWRNLLDQSQDKHIFTSDDDNKPTNNMQMFVLHFWCPHTSFFKFIFDIVQLVVTSADNNSGFIFLIKLNEPVGTGNQIRMKPGALLHQWQKKQKIFFFFAGQFEHPWKQSFNWETFSYTDFSVAKRIETET